MSGGIVGVSTPDPGTNALIQRLSNPPNPLEQAGQSINALGAIKEFAAQNALTGIYQQSIDPATGQVDLGKFNALASQNPAALWKFGQTMQSAGTGVGNEGQGTSAQLNARLDQLGAQAAYMTPLIAKAQAGTVTADDVRGVLKDMPPGLVSPTMIANINQQLADGADPNNVVKGAFFANEHGRATLSGALGPLATVQQGGQTSFVRPGAPFAPGGISSAPLPTTPGVEPVTLTVGTQTIPNVPYNTAIEITQNPEALKRYYPQQYQQMHPGDRVTMSPPPAAGAPPPAAGSAPGAAVTNKSFAPNAQPGRAGRYPGEVQPPPTAPAPAPAEGGGGGGGGGGGATKTQQPLWLQPPTPVAPGAGGGGVGLTAQPWYVENVKKITQPAIDNENTFASQVSATRDVEPILNDMQSQLNVPGIDTGIGYTAKNSVRQLAEKFGIVAPEGQGSSEAMRAQDEFNKDSARLVAAQSGAMGNPTDARTEVAASANPGSMQSTYGNKGIIQMLLGNQQALRAEADAWQKAKAGGWTAGGDENNNFNTWRTDRFLAPDPNPGPSQGGRFDQRVFWLANAPTLDEQRTFAQKIPAGPARAQFVKNLDYANQQGWIKTDDKGLTTVTSP